MSSYAQSIFIYDYNVLRVIWVFIETYELKLCLGIWHRSINSLFNSYTCVPCDILSSTNSLFESYAIVIAIFRAWLIACLIATLASLCGIQSSTDSLLESYAIVIVIFRAWLIAYLIATLVSLCGIQSSINSKCPYCHW